MKKPSLPPMPFTVPPAKFDETEPRRKFMWRGANVATSEYSAHQTEKAVKANRDTLRVILVRSGKSTDDSELPLYRIFR